MTCHYKLAARRGRAGGGDTLRKRARADPKRGSGEDEDSRGEKESRGASEGGRASQTDGRAEAEGRGGTLKSISSVKKQNKTCFCLSVEFFSVFRAGSSSEEGAGGSVGGAVGAGEDRG